MKNQIVNLLSQNIEVLTSEEISQLIEIPPKPEMGDCISMFPSCQILSQGASYDRTGPERVHW